MDCHNHPTHNFRSPDELLDRALSAGKVERSLPYVKREALALMTRSYPDTEEAFKGVRQGLMNFYRQNYPEVYISRGASIDDAITEVQQAYALTAFPDMGVDWRTYADNIGHQASPGCFRCHDGKHVSPEGKVIRQECTTCHTMPP